MDEAVTILDPHRFDRLVGFKEGVVNSDLATTEKAAEQLEPRSLILSGGVAANSRLKELFVERCARIGLKFYYPRPLYTSDNAAMIAAAGTAKFRRGETCGMDMDADPNMRLAVSAKAGDSRRKRWRT